MIEEHLLWILLSLFAWSLAGSHPPWASLRRRPWCSCCAAPRPAPDACVSARVLCQICPCLSLYTV